MTARSDFTEKEWDLLRTAPSTAGMIVITAEKGGQLRESVAMAKAYAEERKEHGESELVDALVSAGPKVESKRFRTVEQRKQHGLQQLHEAAELLDRKASSVEAEEYKRFINELAKRAANATRGRLLRRGDKRISNPERVAIEDIAYALDSGGRWAAFGPSAEADPGSDAD